MAASGGAEQLLHLLLDGHVARNGSDDRVAELLGRLGEATFVGVADHQTGAFLRAPLGRSRSRSRFRPRR